MFKVLNVCHPSVPDYSFTLHVHVDVARHELSDVQNLLWVVNRNAITPEKILHDDFNRPSVSIDLVHLCKSGSREHTTRLHRCELVGVAASTTESGLVGKASTDSDFISAMVPFLALEGTLAPPLSNTVCSSQGYVSCHLEGPVSLLQH